MGINLIKRFWWEIEHRIFLIKERKSIEKVRKTAQKRWKSLGFTEGLKFDIRDDIGKLYECDCKSKRKLKK